MIEASRRTYLLHDTPPPIDGNGMSREDWAATPASVRWYVGKQLEELEELRSNNIEAERGAAPAMAADLNRPQVYLVPTRCKSDGELGEGGEEAAAANLDGPHVASAPLPLLLPPPPPPPCEIDSGGSGEEEEEEKTGTEKVTDSKQISGGEISTSNKTKKTKETKREQIHKEEDDDSKSKIGKQEKTGDRKGKNLGRKAEEEVEENESKNMEEKEIAAAAATAMRLFRVEYETRAKVCCGIELLCGLTRLGLSWLDDAKSLTSRVVSCGLRVLRGLFGARLNGQDNCMPLFMSLLPAQPWNHPPLLRVCTSHSWVICHLMYNCSVFFLRNEEIE